MDNTIRIPLDLPDVRVLEVSQTDQGAWLIRVESTVNGTQCHQCSRPITQFHGVDTAIRLRHLPVFETPVLDLLQNPKCVILAGYPNPSFSQ
jgi:transposase